MWPLLFINLNLEARLALVGVQDNLFEYYHLYFTQATVKQLFHYGEMWLPIHSAHTRWKKIISFSPIKLHTRQLTLNFHPFQHQHHFLPLAVTKYRDSHGKKAKWKRQRAVQSHWFQNVSLLLPWRRNYYTRNHNFVTVNFKYGDLWTL